MVDRCLSYAVQLRLHAWGVRGERRNPQLIDTKLTHRDEEVLYCCAIPMAQPGRVIIGMDLLWYWRLVVDGPRREFSLTIPLKREGKGR